MFEFVIFTLRIGSNRVRVERKVIPVHLGLLFLRVLKNSIMLMTLELIWFRKMINPNEKDFMFLASRQEIIAIPN